MIKVFPTPTSAPCRNVEGLGERSIVWRVTTVTIRSRAALDDNARAAGRIPTARVELETILAS